MAFRHGGFKGKGLVYSRRRGQGKRVNRSLRDGSSIIYEENEGESDSFEMNTQEDIRQNTSVSKTGIDRFTWILIQRIHSQGQVEHYPLAETAD
jgi:hypothetical protein